MYIYETPHGAPRLLPPPIWQMGCQDYYAIYISIYLYPYPYIYLIIYKFLYIRICIYINRRTKLRRLHLRLYDIGGVEITMSDIIYIIPISMYLCIYMRTKLRRCRLRLYDR